MVDASAFYKKCVPLTRSAALSPLVLALACFASSSAVTCLLMTCLLVWFNGRFVPYVYFRLLLVSFALERAEKTDLRKTGHGVHVLLVIQLWHGSIVS